MKYFILMIAMLSILSSNAQNQEAHFETPSIEKTFPVYRGCKKKVSYEDMKKCTTKKIRNFFKMSFDLELADKLFPQDKTAQVLVEFVINKKGKIEQINAKANKREMAVEAIKIMKRLPKLKKPGYVDGKPVNTPQKILMTIYF